MIILVKFPHISTKVFVEQLLVFIAVISHIFAASEMQLSASYCWYLHVYYIIPQGDWYGKG